jgi:hypothetical protein
MSVSESELAHIRQHSIQCIRSKGGLFRLGGVRASTCSSLRKLFRALGYWEVLVNFCEAYITEICFSDTLPLSREPVSLT